MLASTQGSYLSCFYELLLLQDTGIVRVLPSVGSISYDASGTEGKHNSFNFLIVAVLDENPVDLFL